MEYLFTHFNKGGDRYDVLKFYTGAQLFQPHFAKYMSNEEAFRFTDNLAIYPKLSEGDNLLKLKRGCKSYKSHAQQNMAKLEEDGVILSWH